MPRRLLAPVVAALALIAAGCGGADEPSSLPAPTTTATFRLETGNTQAGIRVGLVIGSGRSDEPSLDLLAREGLERAQDELGIDSRVLTSRTSAGYLRNLTALARQDYDLVIAVGRHRSAALAAVAARFPDASFAIVDGGQSSLEGSPRNVRGLLFKEQEAGYLVGYLAGLVVEETGGANPTVSSVGGQKIPPVDRYIAGFRAGVRAASREITTLNAYSQDFVDQAKCKEIALNQISRGSTVVFQVAGQCGLGALNAAEEQNVDGIGVDADQAYLGDHILTSALKKVDVAVYQTVQEVQDGTFAGGGDTVFDVASGGVGLGQVSADVPGDILAQVNAAQARIASGALSDIPEEIG